MHSGPVSCILCAVQRQALRPSSLARRAGVAELVDALDSKSSFRKEVRVRFSLPAPRLNNKKPIID